MISPTSSFCDIALWLCSAVCCALISIYEQHRGVATSQTAYCVHCAGALIWHGRDLRRYKRLLSPPLQRLLTCPGTAALGRGVASMPASYAHQVPGTPVTWPFCYWKCLLCRSCPFTQRAPATLCWPFCPSATASVFHSKAAPSLKGHQPLFVGPSGSAFSCPSLHLLCNCADGPRPVPDAPGI